MDSLRSKQIRVRIIRVGEPTLGGCGQRRSGACHSGRRTDNLDRTGQSHHQQNARTTIAAVAAGFHTIVNDITRINTSATGENYFSPETFEADERWDVAMKAAFIRCEQIAGTQLEGNITNHLYSRLIDGMTLAMGPAY